MPRKRTPSAFRRHCSLCERLLQRVSVDTTQCRECFDLCAEDLQLNDDDATPTKEQRERFEQALMSIRANGGDYNAVRRYCSYAFPDGEALPPLDADPENIDPSDPTTSVELGRMYLGPTGEVFFVTSTAIGRDWLDDCHGDESETLNLTRSTPKCPDDPTIDPDALPVRVRYNVAGY